MGEQAIDFSKLRSQGVSGAWERFETGAVSAEAASRRIAKFGPMPWKKEETSQWAVLFGFFWGPIPWDDRKPPALMAAIAPRIGAIISIIFALLAFNASLGFFEEHQA